MERCFLCGVINVNNEQKFECIETDKVESSQKTIHLVLTHLAKCIQTKLCFQSGARICEACFSELSAYDSIMVNLLAAQKKLTQKLQLALEPQATTMHFEEGEQILEEAFCLESDIKDEDFIVLQDDEEQDLEREQFSNDGDGMGDGYEDEYEEDECWPSDSLQKRQECIICGSTFKSKFQLRYHMTEVHKTQQSHICTICGITRRDEEYLELHMNIHEGKTEKECRYCPKRFSRAVHTLRHMRIHWNKKKFQCEKCGLRFSQDNILYNHRLRHEAEENPLICSTCHLSFKSRKTYNHHILIHQENRPRHYCTLCPKSFTERYTLKMHMKTHSGDVDKSKKTQNSSTKTSLVQQVVEELQMSEETDEAVTVIVADEQFPNSCVICNVKYESVESLNKHLQHDHDVILK